MKMWVGIIIAWAMVGLSVRGWAQDAVPVQPAVSPYMDLVAQILKNLLPTLLLVYAGHITKGVQHVLGMIPKALLPVVSMVIGAVMSALSAAGLHIDLPPEVSIAVGSVTGLASYGVLQSKPITTGEPKG